MSAVPNGPQPDVPRHNGKLLVDAGEIARFVSTLFRYAPLDRPKAFVSLRSFPHQKGAKPLIIRGVRVGVDGLDPVITAATDVAQRTADGDVPGVFAPPICLLDHQYSAAGANLLVGLTLSAELDESPREGLRRLASVLGPATVVVASGGTWTDPQTGELQDKLHIHYRLSEPTTERADHNQLYRARAMAMRLVGADPTGVPVVHGLKWPGSWNRKATPRMSRIVAMNADAELHLIDALEMLEDATASAGISEPENHAVVSGDPQQHPQLVAQWMRAIPNVDAGYDEWIAQGYRACRAMGGDPGFDLWDEWSKKSAKHDVGETETVWRRIVSSARPDAPRKGGAGTLCRLAMAAGWVWTPEARELQSQFRNQMNDGGSTDEGAAGDQDSATLEPEAPPVEIQALLAEATRLAGLDDVAYDRERRSSAKLLKISVGLLDKKVREARDKAGRGGNSAGSASDRFAANVAAIVQEFNAKYMVVNEAGRAFIYQPDFDPVLKRRRYDRMSPRDLGTLHMNRRVQVGVNEDQKPVFQTASEIWLRHPDRRQFINGVTFDPRSTEPKPGVLNLWEGFAVKPAAGDWSLLSGHINAILCNSDPVIFEYTMNWMARMVQRPAEQGEVAIVMKGGEGTGKGTLAKALLKIMGHHGLAISNAKHLVGNFNGHLRDAIMLFADEAFFAGDKQHVGTLKSLITEPYLTVEAKFANAVQSPNFLHVMMASNEEWVVPASLDARRFLVLIASDAAKGNTEYFAAIWEQMDAGGYEAMLHELLHRDLTHFNVRDVPKTEGLQQQQTLSLGTSESWWLDVLHRGYVFRSKLGLEEFFGEWHEVVTTEVLFASYEEYAKAKSERRPMSREAFGEFMSTMGAEAARPRNAVVGEHMADEPVNAYGDVRRQAALVRRVRATGYWIGTLSNARAGFTAKTGLAPQWPSEDDEVER